MRGKICVKMLNIWPSIGFLSGGTIATQLKFWARVILLLSSNYNKLRLVSFALENERDIPDPHTNATQTTRNEIFYQVRLAACSRQEK